jgi:hypothetical protein
MEGKFGKIVLVVLGVILMIVFILPAGLQNMAGSDATLGQVGGEKVRRGDVINADNLYQYATHRIRVPLSQGQDVPLSAAIFGEYAEKLEKDPELFYVLLREARENGTTMPPDALERLVSDLNLKVLVPDRASPDGERLMEFKDITGEQIRGEVLQSAGALLSVNRSFRRYADFPRISTPVLDYFVATQAQRLDLRTVVFDAVQYLDRVEDPTEQEMREHFDKYKDKLPGSVSEENPFGFGYRLEDGVKFQYITISSDTVRSHLLRELAGTTLQQREQDLYQYWVSNRARFPVAPTTQATTQPSTHPTTQPSTQPAPDAGAATTQPTTGPTTAPSEADLLTKKNPEVAAFLDSQSSQVAGRPQEADWKAYVTVHDDVAERYLAGQVAEMKENVAKRVREILNSDYRAFDLARSASGGAATQPARTRVGVAVDDPAYLEGLADLVASELGVRPAVASYMSEFYGQEKLADEAEVGPIASAISIDFQAMFPGYILGATPALHEGALRKQVETSGNALAPYRPSQPVIDALGNDYIFRIAEARPDSPPQDLAQVQDKILEDLRKRAAYDLAETDARRFAEQAQASSLDSAAGSSGLVLHDPQPFVPSAGLLDAQSFGATEADDTISAAARSDLVESIYAFLSDPELRDFEHPIGVLPIRPAFRQVVAELQELIGGWGDDQMLALQREQLHEQLRDQFMRISGPGAEFFDFDRAAARVGYQRSEPRPEEPE